VTTLVAKRLTLKVNTLRKRRQRHSLLLPSLCKLSSPLEEVIDGPQRSRLRGGLP
jgi:hypothetical protein